MKTSLGSSVIFENATSLNEFFLDKKSRHCFSFALGHSINNLPDDARVLTFLESTFLVPLHLKIRISVMFEDFMVDFLRPTSGTVVRYSYLMSSVVAKCSKSIVDCKAPHSRYSFNYVMVMLCELRKPINLSSN